MADCTKCANRNNDYCIFACENGESFKPITNADRVRSMSDEELAVLLEGCICPKEPCPDIDRATEPDKKRCTKCWLDWLRQEAKP